MRLRRANQPNGYASGGLVPDIHPPTPSHLSHTKRSASHTHLGLRPKASDSLHTKIRSSNPQPKHISQIENVVSSAVQAVGGGDVGDVARRKKRELKRGNSMHSNDTSHDTSRAVSPHESQEASTSDTDEKQHPYEDDLETTDIGIYHNDVYDEYLSSTMGKLRKLLVKSLEWESPILAKHQNAVRTPRLDRFFVYTSLMGSHSFFLIFLPMTYWLIDMCFARGLVIVLAAGVYLSSAIKDALCIPRPYSPPVTRLVIGTTHLEYGFLSTHSTNCTSIVLYIYLWLCALRQQLDASSPFQSKLWEAGLLMYAISVVYGRIYCGMHSIMDCLMGCLLGAAISLTQFRLTDTIEKLLLVEGWAVPVVVNCAGLIMVIVHPQPLDDCPCFEDAIAFLSVVMGILTGRWFGVRYNLEPLNVNPLKNMQLGRNSAIFDKDSLSILNLRETPITKPFLDAVSSDSSSSAILSFIQAGIRKSLVLVLGVATVMATRVAVKTVCTIILPPIFRFVQGTFGFILPRRHYTSATDYAAIQAANADGSHARRASLSSLSNVNTKGYHKRQESSNSETFRRRLPRSRSHSLQDEDARNDNSKVKFTMGDGSDVPVPFTHPNTALPGDAFSERLAGALSAEERERQRYESQISKGIDTLGGNDANSFDEEPFDEIRHYDVDVLTKVFVYHAIGFVSGCIIPFGFKLVGLIDP